MVAFLPIHMLADMIMFLALSAVADVAVTKTHHSSSLMRVHDIKLKPRIALEQRSSHMMRLDQSAGHVTAKKTSNVSSSLSSPWSSASAAVDGGGEAVLLALPPVEQRTEPLRSEDPFVPVPPVSEISKEPVDILFPEPVQETLQPQIDECPPPAVFRRGWLIAGFFFFAMGLLNFQREAWLRSTEHAEARGTLDMWSNGRWSTPAGTVFAALASIEVAMHVYGLQMYGQGFSVQGLMGAKNAITCAILSLVAYMDPVVRRHHPVQANRILCCLLASASLVLNFWLSDHIPVHLVALERMFVLLKFTAAATALVLCLQAVIPSSNLRCAACFMLVLHGAFYVDIAGHWLWKSEGSGCSLSDDEQYMAADLHGKVITASVAAWFAAGLSASYVWAVHVQYAMRAECKALMSAAVPRSHE